MTGEIDASTMRLLINLLVECVQEIPQDYGKPRGTIKYVVSELMRASVGPVLVEKEAA